MFVLLFTCISGVHYDEGLWIWKVANIEVSLIPHPSNSLQRAGIQVIWGQIHDRNPPKCFLFFLCQILMISINKYMLKNKNCLHRLIFLILLHILCGL